MRLNNNNLNCCFLLFSHFFSYHLFLSLSCGNNGISQYEYICMLLIEIVIKNIWFNQSRRWYLISMVMQIVVMDVMMIVVMMLLVHDRYILLFCVVYWFVDMYWCVLFNFDRPWMNFRYFYYIFKLIENHRLIVDSNELIEWLILR